MAQDAREVRVFQIRPTTLAIGESFRAPGEKEWRQVLRVERPGKGVVHVWWHGVIYLSYGPDGPRDFFTSFEPADLVEVQDSEPDVA